MAIEGRRGCGYRKVGGIYLVGELEGRPCGRLPIPLTTCPCCGEGIKQSRGWTWVDPGKLLSRAPACTSDACGGCPMQSPESLGDDAGLIWIGAQFYPTVGHFLQEARAMGISRRVSGIPRGFKVGEHYVLLAHPKAAFTFDPVAGTRVECGGVFYIWKPQHIEQIITESQSLDGDFMDGLERQGITPVVVPDDDPDHQGSVYDKPGTLALLGEDEGGDE